MIERIEKPLVSIVMATYRRVDSLERALISLNSQTYSNCEIVIIDDNADIEYSQKVQNCIKQNKSKFEIVYIRNKVNQGSAESRNIGIRAAKGEFITFLDDDDIYLPLKVESQIEFMINNSINYSVTDFELYDENDKLLERRERKYIKSIEPNELIKMHLIHHITGTDTMMFEKEYLLNIGCFSKIDVGDEFYLMEKAILGGGKFGYLDKCYVKAYVHTTEQGLSSGESKICGENKLFEYKSKYFNQFSSKEIKYIKMRHYAVLAFAEIRRKRFLQTLKYGLAATFNSPIGVFELITNRKKCG